MAVVVIALRQIQDDGDRVFRQEFKMAHVDASTESKMVASHALVLLQDGDHACFDIRFKMACPFAKVQCDNSIIYITYLVLFRNFRSTTLLDDFDSPGASFRQMLRYL